MFAPFRTSVLTILTTLPAWSALPAQTDTTRLREIIVTANRVPTPVAALGSSADLIGGAELRRRQVHSLQEALGLISGGTVLSTGAPGGVASVFLRGAASTQTLMLVDGIRVSDANTSYGSLLGGADVTGLGKVEVVRGPQSTLYGGAAIGGVISMDAARGRGPLRTEFDVEGGSFSTWRSAVDVTAGSDRAGISVALTANGTDNQRHPNGWDQRSQLIRVDQRLLAWLSTGATFRGQQNHFNDPGDLRTTNTTPEGTTVFDNSIGTFWVEASPALSWRSKLVIGGQEQFTQVIGRFDGGDPSRFDISNSRRVVDWQNSVTISPAVLLVAGANREWSTALISGDSKDERLMAFYAEGRLSPVREVTVTAGARSDDYNTFGHALTWRVTGAWTVTGATKLRASYGTGFMPPSLGARFGSVFQNPNPAIRPERSRGWDAGVDQGVLDGKGMISVTLFRNSLRDLIVFEGADFPALGREVNLARARTSGVEVSGRVARGALDARLAWTILSARSLTENDPSQDRLIRRPRQSLTADLGLTISSRLMLGSGVVVVANRIDTDFNSFPSTRVNPGDYALARLYGSYDLTPHLTLTLRAENLFDARYEPVYGFPGLGRHLSAGGSVRF